MREEGDVGGGHVEIKVCELMIKGNRMSSYLYSLFVFETQRNTSKQIVKSTYKEYKDILIRRLEEVYI